MSVVFMRHKIIPSLLLLISTIPLAGSATPRLDSIAAKDPAAMALRKDIRVAEAALRSKPAKMLPELVFHEYTVPGTVSFWDITSSLGLEPDTLISVNNLVSSDGISGRTIHIPNMNGILYDVAAGDTLESIARKKGTSPEIILAANRMSSLTKSRLFIPGGTLDPARRQGFLDASLTRPRKGSVRLTSRFGSRRDPFTHTASFHGGVDIGCPVGTPVRAARDGFVSYAEIEDGYGKVVVLVHDKGYETIYGHLSKILVWEKKRVRKGELIALSGNTGRSTGPHLHFEVRKNGKRVHPGTLGK
jgi:hypothetical protein